MYHVKTQVTDVDAVLGTQQGNIPEFELVAATVFSMHTVGDILES